MQPTLRFKFWTRAAMIGALYAALTIMLAPLSYGPLQVRLAEALMVLPYFTPAAIPGLFAGCLVANIYGGYGFLDIIFGSLATLLSALLVQKVANPYFVPLPPVFINALLVGAVLHFVLALPYLVTLAWVGLGELIACYGLGLPLLLLLKKHEHIFK